MRVVLNVFITLSEAEEDKPIVYRCVDWLKTNNIAYYLAKLRVRAGELSC